ncbi:MAG: hypothetical protein H6825_12875, partial [Planctomycetes bacterium]|nr:hypothetical protein [Planctomycetota bacterium]
MSADGTQQVVVVLRDFDIKNGPVLEHIMRQPPPGYDVRVPGISLNRREGQILREVTDEVDTADRVIAFVDKANANVGFEIGYALGKRKPISLVKSLERMPGWIDRSPPLKTIRVSDANTQPQLAHVIRAAPGLDPLDSPDGGTVTLFLCPSKGNGHSYHDTIRNEPIPVRRLPEGAWSLKDLPGPGVMSRVGHVIWVITERRGDDEMPDGADNTTNGLVAGYAHANGCKVTVLRDDAARRIVDVGPLEESVFSSLAEFESAIVAVTGDAIVARAQRSALDRYVQVLLDANKDGRYGVDLLTGPQSEDGDDQEDDREEGVVLIKPGGTFNESCLREVLSRLTKAGRIEQLRLFDGDTIDRRQLFDKQYSPPVDIANGVIRLSDEDFETIRGIYDTDEFEAAYGTPYSPELVKPAQAFHTENDLSPDALSELWDRGRQDHLFWNGRYDGLNKIGHQKSVYPIHIPNRSVAIVVNGFIPGYRSLFTSEDARVVAIWLSTTEDWSVVRDRVVGGKSNPSRCEPGSIRHDAFLGRLPLVPADSVVNG